MDNGSKVHTAHSCRHIQEIYGHMLDEPGGQLSRELFYTMYSKRELRLKTGSG
jgi:hypothetical protein